MFDKFKKMREDQNAAQAEINEGHFEPVKKIFNTVVEDGESYIIGVAQVETEPESGGGKLASFASKALLNTKIVESTDYVVGIHPETKRIAIVEVKDMEPAKWYEFQVGDYSIKKESKLADEAFSMLGGRNNRADQYNRERYNFKSGKTQIRFLVGSYIPEGTAFPYIDNAKIIEVLNKL